MVGQKKPIGSTQPGTLTRLPRDTFFLRQGGRLDASKHLVRNAIEMLILLMAVQKKPELLFRIAFKEHEDKKTQVRCMKYGDVAAAESAINKQWSDFKSAYRTKYPEQALVENALGLRDIAHQADLQPYYDTHYRLYCRFTHAALEATTGSLKEFDGEDNRTMALCALAGIEALSSIGSSTPNLEPLRKRLADLT